VSLIVKVCKDGSDADTFAKFGSHLQTLRAKIFNRKGRKDAQRSPRNTKPRWYVILIAPSKL